MAVAFYIPDQAALMRKARQQEQQILAMREAHWRYVASVVYDVLRQYLQATPSILGRTSSSGSTQQDKSSNSNKK
ncbi:cell death protein rpr [Musca vetustissima]|uniref:cell death protein rpr n=1 Tax=Musca vetustissima TaxID=27455 RepID=UPI002AB794FF|nr:cell death protein rpr [Musca vetustissima]